MDQPRETDHLGVELKPLPHAFQFRLKSLFFMVTAIAVALAAFRSGSVYLFLVLLTTTVGGVVVAIRRAIACELHWRLFYGCIALVGAGGVALTLLARFPITGTPLVQVMWSQMTNWGRGFTWGAGFDFNASSHLASVYLIETWIAAFLSGTLLSLLIFLRRKSRQSSR